MWKILTGKTAKTATLRRSLACLRRRGPVHVQPRSNALPSLVSQFFGSHTRQEGSFGQHSGSKHSGSLPLSFHAGKRPGSCLSKVVTKLVTPFCSKSTQYQVS